MSAPPTNHGDPSLCVGCGMCCDGTLYGRARVSPGEEPRVAGAGLELVEGADRTYFRLPCHFFGCGRCTIYEDRFDVCRTFTCALYRRQEAREITPEKARSIVDQALALRSKVTAAFPEAGVHRNRQQLRGRLAKELSGNFGEDRRTAAQSLLDLVALDTFLERWFRNQKDKDQETAGARAEHANS
jgi:Fe-S-cluster containining protein